MINKDLLNYLGKDKTKLVYIILLNVLGLLFSVALTFSFVYSLYAFIDLDFFKGSMTLLAGLAFGVGKMACVFAGNKISSKLADKITLTLREETYKRFLALDAKTPFTVNEMAQLSTEGIEQLRLYYVSYLPSFFYAMIAPLVLFILLSIIDWKVALLYLCMVPLIPMSIVAVSKWAKKLFAKYWDKYTSLGDDFLDNTKGMKELKVFLYDDIRQKDMDAKSEDFRKITMKVLVMQLASVTIMDLVAFGGAAIGIALSLGEMLNGVITIYSTIFLILVGAEYFLPMRTLGSAFHVAMNGATAGVKILKLLELKIPQDGKEVLTKIDNVEFKGLDFSYDSKEFLKDVNIKMEKGLYSLVGVSGSGKSTLAKLLARILNPTKGQILINGQDIHSYTKDSFYNKVCYISNNTYLFHTSIRDLFKFYNKDIEESRMKELLNKLELPFDLDYKIMEDYANISGGEKQRLTLALYLSNSYDLYIFDEITSNIDIESEEIILKFISSLSKDHICLMISHRLKATQNSKEVYYLEDGKILLHDNYDKLLSYDNSFKKLYDLQVSMEAIR